MSAENDKYFLCWYRHYLHVWIVHKNYFTMCITAAINGGLITEANIDFMILALFSFLLHIYFPSANFFLLSISIISFRCSRLQRHIVNKILAVGIMKNKGKIYNLFEFDVYDIFFRWSHNRWERAFFLMAT